MWLPLIGIFIHTRCSLKAAGRERCKASEAAPTASRRGTAQALSESSLRRRSWELYELVKHTGHHLNARMVIIALISQASRRQHTELAVKLRAFLWLLTWPQRHPQTGRRWQFGHRTRLSGKASIDIDSRACPHSIVDRRTEGTEIAPAALRMRCRRKCVDGKPSPSEWLATCCHAGTSDGRFDHSLAGCPCFGSRRASAAATCGLLADAYSHLVPGRPLRPTPSRNRRPRRAFGQGPVWQGFARLASGNGILPIQSATRLLDVEGLLGKPVRVGTRVGLGLGCRV